ncbi:MAG: hypothetical protein ACAI38_01615 [Myxococcota bacterium]|nr:hypothetical protein [Myxococcota bacterium]
MKHIVFLLVAVLPAAARAEPTVDLPPAMAEDAAPEPRAEPTQQPLLRLGVDNPTDELLLRGLQPARLATDGTVIGGYSQMRLSYTAEGERSPFTGQANIDRLVLFVAHTFDERFQTYIEFEWENAIACSNCQGSVEIEQAFLDWHIAGRALTLRSGLILVPMGIINQWHEPPVFHGVSRPIVDQLIIPTTWREIGLGFTGSFSFFNYELYLLTAPDALAMDQFGLRSAQTQGSLAPANAWMVAGRLEAEPLLGFIAGISGIGSDMGGGSRFYEPDRSHIDLALPLYAVEIDARWRRFGLEARALATAFFFPHADQLLGAYDENGTRQFPNPRLSGVVPTRWWGAYVEVAYDVLRLITTTEQQLMPFVRLEAYDNQAAVPDGYTRDRSLKVMETTFGLSYRPIRQVVLKSDLQLRDRDRGDDLLVLNFGLGTMF